MKESTRKKIVSVAQKIFASKGIIKTTMGDVAKACGLGRRTLYTYFKTREDLYSTVVKKEIDAIIKRMHSIVSTNVPPEKKIVTLLATHMESVEDLIARNRVLKLDFLTRHERIEGLRKELDKQEKAYIKSILVEGTNSGAFAIEDPEKTAVIAHTTLKGLEVEFILDNFGKKCKETLKLCQSIFLKGITSSKLETKFSVG